MSTTGLEVFDTTLQKTNEWLQDIMQEFGTENRQQAYDALRATLHTLRDRLPVDETAHLGAQLPMLVRGIYYEGWRPSPHVQKLGRAEFLERVSGHFARTAFADIDPERVVRAVFYVLSRRIAAGETEKLVSVLPAELKELWPSVQTVTSRAQTD
jgi:uncharacterized protein (DUF2267 family)